MAYETAPVTAEKLAQFLSALTTLQALRCSKAGMKISPTYTAEVGSRYARIVATEYASRSAYCFVEMATGLLLKTAGWKAPAKHARGTIHTPTYGTEFCGPYGMEYLR